MKINLIEKITLSIALIILIITLYIGINGMRVEKISENNKVDKNYQMFNRHYGMGSVDFDVNFWSNRY